VTRLLLIGNSRWHWAEQAGSGWRCWHEQPQGERAALACAELQAWAAVGAVPSWLEQSTARRLELADVPLLEPPAWLGIDRALVGWGAWRQQGHGVLVADAGTALSLTRIDHAGAFRGGRISAGVSLQLQALHRSTALLPPLNAMVGESPDAWPMATAAAMQEGCLRATAAAIAAAWGDLIALEPEPASTLWLTGGDGERLQPLLRQQGIEPVLAPDLALQALAALPVLGWQRGL
jgi:type III pantothenate kinase